MMECLHLHVLYFSRLMKPCSQLNLPTLQSVVPALVCTLKGKKRPGWKEPKPDFWPDTIPFCNPSQAPPGWNQRSRLIINAFSYNTKESD